VRLLALLALVFALGLLVAACGGKGGNKNDKVTPNLTAPGPSSVPAGGQSGTTP
jgi:hypothetical protein